VGIGGMGIIITTTITTIIITIITIIAVIATGIEIIIDLCKLTLKHNKNNSLIMDSTLHKCKD
jgi:hypothetical protein